MSVKNRLAKKMEGLIVPTKNEAPPSPSVNTPLRTGPGQMLMVNSLMRDTNERVATLEARLKEFEGTLPVRLLDATKVVPSKWANRLEPSFLTREYEALRQEIAVAHGNVQPIKVRPLAGSDQFEIVFGHRRHRACRDLGLPVLALIEEVNDQDLFKAMDRENRTRRDLSVWELGVMYRRALDERLFGTLTDLARELGVDKGNVSKALKLADLPQEVVAAFPSPLDLQYRWAKLLDDALATNRDAVVHRAKQLSAGGNKGLAGKAILARLLGEEAAKPSTREIHIKGARVAVFTIDNDRAGVKFEKGVLSMERANELAAFLTKLLG